MGAFPILHVESAWSLSVVEGLEWFESVDYVEFVELFLGEKFELLCLLKDSKPEIRFLNSSEAT